VLHSDDGKNTIDLTPVHAVVLPEVPVRTVYLVPIGLQESLDWASPYYKSKLDIDVRVLPATALDNSLLDSTRHQLDSEKCIYEFLLPKYPDLARDPSAIIIAVTSTDIYIPSLGWSYAENLRREGRFAVISSARLHPLPVLDKLNPEWLASRLQKLLTKNIAMLYFGLPMSEDYTSLLSGGVLSGREIDRMAGDIVGQQGQWSPFIDAGAPAITLYKVPGKELVWTRGWADHALLDTKADLFTAELDVGLLVQRKADFLFPNEPAMNFVRVYRNQDERARAFGVGGTHEFDMFLGGKMRVAVDLILADGLRVQFLHKGPVLGEAGDVYEPRHPERERFIRAVFSGNIWHVKTRAGWVYDFPYCPQALPQYVTVLTGFTDAAHHRYEMKRDPSGALLEIISPAGTSLRFENDANHRIHRITASDGRSMQYDYNEAGGLIRVRASDGFIDFYSYDDKGQMLTVAHGDGQPVLTNEYFVDGCIKTQTLSNGKAFRYGYSRQGMSIKNSYITYPNGLESYVQYERGGYSEWPPSAPPN
jgi:YD repeat-containing protein